MPKLGDIIPAGATGGARESGRTNCAEADTGGILYFPEALRLYPEARIVIYNRVSSRNQAGRKCEKLEAKTDSIVREVRRLAPLRLRRIVRAVEEGKLSTPRPLLVETCKSAWELGAMVVAPDLSRFLRSEAYSRRTNRNAWPTEEEFCRMRELTGGVPLATVERPDLQEDERHSRATRRSGKAGRPRSIEGELAERIFTYLGCHWFTFGGVWRWERPLREAAKAFGVSVPSILRASVRPSPDGRTWHDKATAKAEERGLLKIGDDGYIECLLP